VGVAEMIVQSKNGSSKTAFAAVRFGNVLARGGEVFVLDMGEQIKVLEMARSLIRLSGFVPETDIPITFTGLRPGEKLYEELVGIDESVESPGTEKISRIRRNQLVDPTSLERHLAELQRCTTEGSLADMQRALQQIVPTYAPGPDMVGTCGGGWSSDRRPEPTR